MSRRIAFLVVPAVVTGVLATAAAAGPGPPARPRVPAEPVTAIHVVVRTPATLPAARYRWAQPLFVTYRNGQTIVRPQLP